LEDVDYADDLGLVTENVRQAQERMTRLARKAKGVGLKVSGKKTQIMRMNCEDDGRILLEGQVLEDVEKFVYWAPF
jgi:hypothetical protein